jgi:alpha-beta hydrolase superfamily lysophospholipase
MACVPPPTLRGYTTEDHWARYQGFFPERYRLTKTNLPVEEWWSWRGAQIHLDRYASGNAPLTVLLLHGGGGYSRLLAPLAVMLRARGFSVVAPDLPGYGLSLAPARFFTYDAWVDCASDLLREEHARRLPVVLFGLSLGGYLAYQVAARTRIASGLMATTLADPRAPLVRDQFAKSMMLSRVGVPLMRGIGAPMSSLRIPMRWVAKMDCIANDRALADIICADPLGGGKRIPIGFLRSLFSMQPILGPEAFDLCPVLLAHPGDDRWTTLAASRPFFDRIKSPKKLILLEGCGHFPIEEPGVTLLENSLVEFLRCCATGNILAL